MYMRIMWHVAAYNYTNGNLLHDGKIFIHWHNVQSVLSKYRQHMTICYIICISPSWRNVRNGSCVYFFFY